MTTLQILLNCTVGVKVLVLKTSSYPDKDQDEDTFFRAKANMNLYWLGCKINIKKI